MKRKMTWGALTFVYLLLAAFVATVISLVNVVNAKTLATPTTQALQFTCDGADFNLYLDSEIGIAKATLTLEPGLWVEIPQQTEKDYAAFYNLESSKLLKFGKHDDKYFVATYTTPKALKEDKAELRLRCRL